MQLISAPRPEHGLVRLLSGTLVGATLVATGLSLAFLVIETPLVASLVPGSRGNPSQLTIAMLVWALGLVAGGSLLVAGTNRLAVAIATVRVRGSGRTPVASAIRRLPADVVVATGVVPHDGRPIPELVIGPFGVAVVHSLEPRAVLRRAGGSWEARTSGGWAATEAPLDRLARDADRVRRWLTAADLDFVVRVYAALVTTDVSIARSTACAVITPDQIPAWIEALPKQRSLTAGRRHHLLARVRDAVVEASARRDW